LAEERTLKAKEIAELMSRDVEVWSQKLLSGGKRDSRYWVCGSVAGEAGQSLKVNLAGSKKGRWADYATGECGDLLDLLRITRGLTMSDAIIEAKRALGIRDEVWEKPVKYTAPAKPSCHYPQGDALQWLYTRGFSDKTIRAFKVGSYDDQGKLYVVFPYLFGDKLRMCKRRNVNDKKDQRPTSANQEKCLFGWQAIPEGSRTVVLCEGELDAMALHEYGIAALSVPFGGGGGEKQDWVQNEYQNMERFDEIFLCMDMDDPGKEAAQELVKRLGADRCRIVELPAKDANDCLLNGVTREAVFACFESAKAVDPSELKNIGQYEDKILGRLFGKEDAAPYVHVPWSKLHTTFRLRFGELTVLNGINGHGKSQGAGHMFVHAMAQGYDVCIASMELRPDLMGEKMLRQIVGIRSGLPSEDYARQCMEFFKAHCWVFAHTGTAKAERILEVFTYARKRYGIKIFLIDSLMKCGFAEDDYNGQKLFIEKLCDFKNEYDAHVMLITHSKKKDDEKGKINKFDVKGTSAITDLADNVINWMRNKRKEEVLRGAEKPGKGETIETIQDRPDAYMAVEKQRNGDWEGTAGLWFCRNSYQFLGSSQSNLYEYVKPRKFEVINGGKTGECNDF
jgi:twinkle protein